MRFAPFLASSIFLFLFPSLAIPSADRLTVYDKVPDFTFVERSGKEMKLSDLRGQVWIADFIFTRCQGMCPMLSGRMTTFQEKLSLPNVKFVSFSVDPAYDTPEVLREYAVRFKAQEGKWFFLTGAKQKMWNFVTNGFFLGVEKPTPEELKQGAEPVIHSGRFVLVDQEGNIRGYYDSSEPEKMKQLVEDALKLASQ